MEVGDTVVTMSAPGRFRVIAVDGATVVIESAEGVRKTVLATHVRKVDGAPAHAR